MKAVSTFTRTLIAAVLAGATLGPAWAQPAPRFEASTEAIGYNGVRDQDFLTSATGGVSAGAGLNQSDPQPNGNLRWGGGATGATAGPTVLALHSVAQSHAEALPGGSTVGGGFTTWGRASASVPFLVSAPGFAGQSGTMLVPLLVSGQLRSTQGLNTTYPGSVSDVAQVWLSVSGSVAAGTPGCPAGVQQCHTLTGIGTLAASGAPLSTMLVSFPFTFGQWTSFDMMLEGRASSTATATSNQSPNPAQVRGLAQVDHQVQWGGIQLVQTGAGVPVTNWTVSSMPGVNLALPVPEPGTAGLLAAGVAALGWLRRRRPDA